MEWAIAFSVRPVGPEAGQVVFPEELRNGAPGFAERGLGGPPKLGAHVALVFARPGGFGEKPDGLVRMARGERQVSPPLGEQTMPRRTRGCEAVVTDAILEKGCCTGNT
jgi:hypothetical protein